MNEPTTADILTILEIWLSLNLVNNFPSGVCQWNRDSDRKISGPGCEFDIRN